jgi:hypothetical protein
MRTMNDNKLPPWQQGADHWTLTHMAHWLKTDQWTAEHAELDRRRAAPYDGAYLS